MPENCVGILMNMGKAGTVFGIAIAIPGLLAIQLLAGSSRAFAGDLRIPLPRRSLSTPTQNLNRDGVAELKRGHQKKAKRLFYRAYLLDPDDPFTLNNLGYIAELEGDADRARRYYALAARDHTDAVIDESSESELKGKPLDEAYRQVHDFDQEVGNLEINKINGRAINLLQTGRVFDARNLLQSALARYPRDPFLLNNLGYAMESVGDLEGAQRYYSAAASVHSTQRVVVTPRAKWRGRPIGEVAKENALAISQEIARGEGVEAAAARLNLRGVVSLNDNDPDAARQFFLQAYQRDAQNAFTLNNLGYLAELAGDRETAEMYYEAARSGRDANARVSYATRRDAEGQKIENLANDNQVDVESKLKAIQATKRRSRGPIELKRRDAVLGINSGSSEQETTPVPAIEVRPPALPALPPPNSEQDRNAVPHPQPSDSSPLPPPDPQQK
jgi:Flp pilus assembly protein TadD